MSNGIRSQKGEEASKGSLCGDILGKLTCYYMDFFY